MTQKFHLLHQQFQDQLIEIETGSETPGNIPLPEIDGGPFLVLGTISASAYQIGSVVDGPVTLMLDALTAKGVDVGAADSVDDIPALIAAIEQTGAAPIGFTADEAGILATGTGDDRYASIQAVDEGNESAPDIPGEWLIVALDLTGGSDLIELAEGEYWITDGLQEPVKVEVAGEPAEEAPIISDLQIVFDAEVPQFSLTTNMPGNLVAMIDDNETRTAEQVEDDAGDWGETFAIGYGGPETGVQGRKMDLRAVPTLTDRWPHFKLIADPGGPNERASNVLSGPAIQVPEPLVTQFVTSQGYTTGGVARTRNITAPGVYVFTWGHTRGSGTNSISSVTGPNIDVYRVGVQNAFGNGLRDTGSSRRYYIESFVVIVHEASVEVPCPVRFDWLNNSLAESQAVGIWRDDRINPMFRRGTFATNTSGNDLTLNLNDLPPDAILFTAGICFYTTDPISLTLGGDMTNDHRKYMHAQHLGGVHNSGGNRDTPGTSVSVTHTWTDSLGTKLGALLAFGRKQ